IEVLVTLIVASVATAAVAHSAWSLVGSRRDIEALQAATIIAERSLEEMIARGAARLSTESSLDRVTDPLGDFPRRRVVEAGPRARFGQRASLRCRDRSTERPMAYRWPQSTGSRSGATSTG